MNSDHDQAWMLGCFEHWRGDWKDLDDCEDWEDREDWEDWEDRKDREVLEDWED